MKERKVQRREDCRHLLNTCLLPRRLCYVAIMWLTGSRRYMEASLHMTGAIPSYKTKYIPHCHLPSPSGESQSAWRISLLLIVGLKLYPGSNVVGPGHQCLLQLETFPIEEWCTKKAEHNRQNVHLPQSHRMAWVGRDLKGYLVPTSSARGRDSSSYTWLLKVSPTLLLKHICLFIFIIFCLIMMNPNEPKPLLSHKGVPDMQPQGVFFSVMRSIK